MQIVDRVRAWGGPAFGFSGERILPDSFVIRSRLEVPIDVSSLEHDNLAGCECPVNGFIGFQ